MEAAAPNISVGTKLEPKRMVGIALFAFTLAMGMFLDRVTAAVLGALKVNNAQLLGVEELSISAVVGFGLAIIGGLYCYFNPRIHAGSIDIASELKRVTWPSMAETRISTVAVIVASIISSLVLFFFDFVASKAMTIWVPHLLRLMAG